MIILSRRAFLVSGAAAVATLRNMPADPACVLTTEQEEGPYYVDYGKVRRDITEGKPGVPLKLRIALLDANKCMPLQNAALDIWHCDATGVYSAYTHSRLGPPPGGMRGRPPGPPPDGDPPDGFGPPPDGAGPPPGDFGHHMPGDDTRFLRGVQTTNSSGVAEFLTIYPGWYEGRAIHIHVKVHTNGHVAHTGQLFFPEDVTSRIAQLRPYSQHQDVEITSQREDHIFTSEHGASGLVTLERVEPRSDAAGFIASVTLAVDPDATPKMVGMHGRRQG